MAQDAFVYKDRGSASSAAAHTWDKTGLQYVDLTGIAYVNLQFYGTYNAVWQIEVSNDLTNWAVANAIQQDSSVPSVEKHSQAGSSPTVFSGPTHGARYLRVRVTTYTSGTQEIIIMGRAGSVSPSTQPVMALNDSKSSTASAPAAGTVGTGSAQLVASNNSRKGVYIKNLDATQNVSLGFGATAVAGSGRTLKPGEEYTMGELDFTTAAINAIASGAGSVPVAVQEYT